MLTGDMANVIPGAWCPYAAAAVAEESKPLSQKMYISYLIPFSFSLFVSFLCLHVGEATIKNSKFIFLQKNKRTNESKECH